MKAKTFRRDFLKMAAALGANCFLVLSS
ncbi:MAG: twin-arginine translocation signal domain-containing protein [Pirellulaceae bacterium]